MKQYFTKEGLEKLKKELECCKTIKRREIAESLKHAISFGDLSENFAYQDAKESQTFLEHRIRELEDSLRNAVLIEKEKTDKVRAGASVTICQDDQAEERFTIVGPKEADPLSGKISTDSPFGSKMMGRKAGDSFEAETPAGKVKCKIIKIE